MFYSWFLESGYAWKDGLQSAVRGVYLQNKLSFEVCTRSDWVTVKNYLLVLKYQWIQLRNYFFFFFSCKTSVISKKKGKQGTILLEWSECWMCAGIAGPLHKASALSGRAQAVQNSRLPDAWPGFLLVCFCSHSLSPFLLHAFRITKAIILTIKKKNVKKHSQKPAQSH